MISRSWFRSLFYGKALPRFAHRCHPSRLRPAGVAPGLEALEDRLAPATISIGDANAIEGSDELRFTDNFVAPDGYGLRAPKGIAVGPDGNVYVSSRDTDVVKVFEGGTGRFLRDLAAPDSLDGPWAVTFGKDNRLYVSGEHSHNIVRFDIASGAADVFATVESGLFSWGMVFGPDGDLYASYRDNVANNSELRSVRRFSGLTGASLGYFVPPGSPGLTGQYSPTDLNFGPDGNLYVISDRAIQRYNGQTGAFIEEFVPKISSGEGMVDMHFHTDGYLYVTYQNVPGQPTLSRLYRYSATTGAFVDVISGPPGPEATGRDLNRMAFAPTGECYVIVGVAAELGVAGQSGQYVARYAPSSFAAFKVSLDTATSAPVSVDFTTANGTAQAADDFIQTSGSLTFAPGERSRTILVPTVENSIGEPTETFVVNLFNPVGATLADGQGVGMIQDNDSQGPFTTTTTLTATPSASTGGQLVTFIATMTPSPVNLGAVTFRDNGVTLAANVPVVGNVATFQISSLSAGTHPVSASFSGVGSFLSSTSNTVSFVVRTPPATLVRSHFPEGTQTAGNFGAATAADKDYYVVGMPFADVGGIDDAGAVSVYSRATGALVANLANPAPLEHDDFGFAVAVSGNLAVVGADDFNSFGIDGIGAAYVFNSATGALIATLANPAPDAIVLFGETVAISGNTVAVGGFVPTGIGQVFIFNATTGALTGTIDSPAPAGTDDDFGFAVALSGNTLVVGAPGDVPGGGSSGRAYVFNAATKQLLATLDNPAPDDRDSFGYAVAVSGNIVVVSAPNDDAGATDSGQAYAFNAATGALLATLANPAPATGDFFGDTVAVSGSLAVVGTPNDDTGASNSGQAYVFSATTGDLLQTLANPSPASNDRFGSGTSIAGNTVVVGAANDDTANANQGAAYVFTIIGAPVVTSVTVNGNIAGLAGAQRSRVASLVVAFDQPVLLDPNAFTLALHTSNVSYGGAAQPGGYGSLPTSLNVTTTDNKTWIVTFASNTDAGADGFHSLKDGVYDLAIDAAKVHLLGVPGLTMSANQTTTFHRLYGDTGAPATPPGGTAGTDFEANLSTADNLAYRSAFNKPTGGGYQPFLDFNGDGIINTVDNLQFRSRFNKALTWRT